MLIFTLENTHGCKCRVIPVDFSCDQDIYKDISDQIRDLDVGILGKLKR